MDTNDDSHLNEYSSVKKRMTRSGSYACNPMKTKKVGGSQAMKVVKSMKKVIKTKFCKETKARR